MAVSPTKMANTIAAIKPATSPTDIRCKSSTFCVLVSAKHLLLQVKSRVNGLEHPHAWLRDAHIGVQCRILGRCSKFCIQVVGGGPRVKRAAYPTHIWCTQLQHLFPHPPRPPPAEWKRP